MDILLISLLALLASGVGTFTGFGVSTIMVPILLFFFPILETLLLAGIVHWFTQLWNIIFFRRSVRWPLILAFGVPGIVATWIGARLVVSVPAEDLLRVLGGFFVVYVAFLFFKPDLKLQPRLRSGVIGGGLSGFLAGIFGVGGAVRSAFLTVFDLPKEVYLMTGAVIGIVIDSTRLVAYWQDGVQLSRHLYWGLGLIIPASFIGSRIAKKIVNRIPQDKFRLVVSLFLFLAGLKFLLLP